MKLYIKAITLASLLSICLVTFLSSNCSAALISNNILPVYTAAESLGYAAAASGHTAATASPTLITPQDSGITINTISIHKNGSVSSQGGFLFYSNNPEYVFDYDLADNGCWLNQAAVSGNGQVYIWHNNAANKTINSELNITNPNNESIIINSNHYGLTNGIDSTDATAWDSYLGSNQTGISIIIKPGQSVQLFKQSVPQNNNFGIVAEVNITDLNGNPAKALFEDRAYYQNIWEVKCTGYSINGSRGVGSSYQNTITFDPVKMTGNNYYTYSIGAADDSLNGQDLVKIKDNRNYNESLLAGNYGEVMTINIPIKNYYKNDQNFGIYIGSIGGYSFPFVKLKDNKSFVSSPVKPFTAYDMIKTGKMNFGSTETVSFTLVIPALSSTPWIIGVHPIE
ncbi:MAG: hypothetical protein ABFD18_17475 [Syntrophomonas sp.]